MGGGRPGHVCRREEAIDNKVPASLGYSDQGAGDIIPGGATLYFRRELMGVEEGPTPVNVFAQIDQDGDKGSHQGRDLRIPKAAG